MNQSINPLAEPFINRDCSDMEAERPCFKITIIKKEEAED